MMQQRRIIFMVFVLFAATQVNGKGSRRTSVSQLFTPTSIPDGILVTGGDDARAHIATWTVLVTLDVPTLEVSLLPKLYFFNAHCAATMPIVVFLIKLKTSRTNVLKI